ncbi:uncharacterized protein LOC131191688 isoform X3 [Ahaetulla prasina]|uniref:uncharacterized protein LOC131191688 isoform X3 n=1 Tax=Ahaetulla prasina TaxID=499056 RepID=UPI002649EE28|nr:uncharacterized protein LOC131191688 isoform X3 [Ahaetulla prasina]
MTASLRPPTGLVLAPGAGPKESVLPSLNPDVLFVTQKSWKMSGTIKVSDRCRSLTPEMTSTSSPGSSDAESAWNAGKNKAVIHKGQKFTVAVAVAVAIVTFFAVIPLAGKLLRPRFLDPDSWTQMIQKVREKTWQALLLLGPLSPWHPLKGRRRGQQGLILSSLLLIWQRPKNSFGVMQDCADVTGARSRGSIGIKPRNDCHACLCSDICRDYK